MAVYWTMLIWVVIIGGIQQKYTRLSLVDGEQRYITTKRYAFWLLFAIVFFAGMCTECIDRGSYIFGFNRVPTAFSDFNAYIDSRKDSELFYGLQMIFKICVSKNASVWMMLIAMVQGSCLIKGLRTTTTNMAMSIYIFVASALAISWMFNGIRQFIAVAVLFANWKLLLTNKWWKFVLINIFVSGISPIYSVLGLGRPVWFLCGIHQSAWLMVPISLIIRGRAWNKKLFFIILLIGIIILTGGLEALIGTAVENTTYADDLANASAGIGTNVTRFLVSAVPVIFAIVKKRKILSPETPPYIHLCVNASIVTASLYFVSVLTSGIYMGRLPIYTELLNLILLPWLINHCDEKTGKMISTALYILYFIYFIYQMYGAWGGMYYCSAPLGIYLE